MVPRSDFASIAQGKRPCRSRPLSAYQASSRRPRARHPGRPSPRQPTLPTRPRGTRRPARIVQRAPIPSPTRSSPASTRCRPTPRPPSLTCPPPSTALRPACESPPSLAPRLSRRGRHRQAVDHAHQGTALARLVVPPPGLRSGRGSPQGPTRVSRRVRHLAGLEASASARPGRATRSASAAPRSPSPSSPTMPCLTCGPVSRTRSAASVPAGAEPAPSPHHTVSSTSTRRERIEGVHAALR